MGDIVPHPFWLVASSSWVKAWVQCSLSAWYARAECCRCLVSSIPLRGSCDCVVYAAGCDAHCPTTTETLPLRTTGPATARTSANDARTRGRHASVSRHHNLVSKRRRLQVVEDARRGIRILEDLDVGLFERIAVKRTSDLCSEL